MPKIRNAVLFATALCACAAGVAMAESAGENPQEVLIDFEGYPESTRIGAQYAEQGVTFRLGGSSSLPIISTEGAPATAFGGYDGSFDTPFVSGNSGLTDPPGTTVLNSSDIVIEFAKPVSHFSVWVIDIDGGHGEHWTDSCRIAGADLDGIVLDMMTLDAEDPGTGDLAHTYFELVAPEDSKGISRVLIDVTQSMGYAIDDVRFTFKSVPGPDDGGGEGEGEGEGEGGPDDGPGDDIPPHGGGGIPGGTVYVYRPVGQEFFSSTYGYSRAFLTSEPDGSGEQFADVPFTDGAFSVQADLLPCGIPAYWTLVGTGPRGNTVRYSDKQDPIIRRPFADLTLDGAVDTADLGVLINAYLSGNLSGDLNRDGSVDTADLGLLIGVFGSTCHD